MSMDANRTAIDDFAAAFGGAVLRSADVGYDEARRVHNGLIDKRPAVIACCSGTADVVAALALGRSLGLDIAVRGGGHNVAGKATVDGGMMIDLAPMTAVLVDAKARRARVQGGATWAHVNRETQVHGLAVTGGVVSSTGVAGLTLGGGLGWLMAKHGLALDNLLSVEVVTADGKVLVASADDHPDLFWGLRGGGGNFGIATTFEFALHSVGPLVVGGLVAHPFPKAAEVLRFYRDTAAGLGDDMVVFGALTHAPDGSGMKMAALLAAHFGDPAAATAAMQPLKSFGPPVMDAIGPLPYNALNAMLDDGNPRGALNYWKSSFLTELSDGAIDTMIDCFARCPSPMSALLLEHFHGQVARVAPDATAFAHRVNGFNILILGQWQNPSETAACTAWVRATYDALRPFMASGRYVNYLADDEAGDPVRAAYGANYPRLQAVKAKYDPENVFRLNQNIQPG